MSVTLAREELARISPGRDAAVTIGKFDGVHRGHQHLIARLIERARAESWAISEVNGRMPTLSGPSCRSSSSRSSRLVR